MAGLPRDRKQGQRAESADPLKSVIGCVVQEACRANCQPERNPPAVQWFRLLPPVGFWWPVHVEQVGASGRERYRPPLDARGCQAIMRAIKLALKLGSDEEQRAFLLGDVDGEGEWEGRPWPWGVTREVLERALVVLVVTATEVLEEGEGWEMYEDGEGFVRELKGWNDGISWFSRKEVGGEVLVGLLRLIMVARQGWVETPMGNGGGPEGRETLANAVDGLLNVVEGRVGGDREVMEMHWRNEEGWRFVNGEKLKGGWVC
ncbi:hypothetical protein QBC34DRAFT_466827 [Podospora aff. communis PSN243]|uniref:Uncharacterized protein n=1 Tax=Podospora aff. communis PSN243 TaxID=3040156 RepID=A0AAV9GME1_9PEZI|nr:hypothetical protein QBC34DRAFT_466827 [Podospora aff. communis PSN243]